MVAVLYHDHHVKGGNVTPRFSSPKAYDSIITDLICSFKLSVKDIQSFVCVSDSTVYRWIHQPDDQISWKNYQKLLSLYCRCYLRDKCDFFKSEENNVRSLL